MATEEKKKAEQLEAGYTKGHRLYEIGAMTSTVVCGSWLFVNLLKCNTLSGWWVPLAALLGILAADFTSGFVHWMFDTWGDLDTPVFGKLAIRTFRHHHVDAKAITRHDFIETNGHNFGLSMLPATLGLIIVRPATASLVDMFVGMALLGLVVFNACTSQIHKWAHMDDADRPAYVKFLQRWRLIVHPDHHNGHHSAPYTRNYCITLGWMNGPLRAVRFFETLEWLITAVTGVLPRVDDLGKDAALETQVKIAADAKAEAPVTVILRD